MSATTPYYTEKYTSLAECPTGDFEPGYAYILGRVYKKSCFAPKAAKYIYRKLLEFKDKFKCIEKKGLTELGFECEDSDKFILCEHFIRGLYEQRQTLDSVISIKCDGWSVSDILGLDVQVYTGEHVPKFLDAIYKTRDGLVSRRHFEHYEKIIEQTKYISGGTRDSDFIPCTEYLRGLYERGPPNYMYHDSPGKCITLFHKSPEKIVEFLGVEGKLGTGQVTFSGSNVLDFLSIIYDSPLYMGPQKVDFGTKNLHYKFYESLCTPTTCARVQKFKYSLSNGGLAPSKSRASDSGYDLTLVSLLKSKGNAYWYDTGVSVEPAPGFYFDLVPRSSICKTGYILANSVGIIDRSYTGNVVAVLLKIDPDAPDLELPCRMVQIIPRPITHQLATVKEDLTETQRASDGGLLRV